MITYYLFSEIRQQIPVRKMMCFFILNFYLSILRYILFVFGVKIRILCALVKKLLCASCVFPFYRKPAFPV